MPSAPARAAGALYLMIFIAAPFAEVAVRGHLVDAGNAASTAENLRAHADLFRPVGRGLSAIAASFRLMHAAIAAGVTSAHFAALYLLTDAHITTAFPPQQQQALAAFSLRVHARGYDIGLIFFGLHCMITGYLIYRSGLLPRVLGVSMFVAGLCWFGNSTVNLLALPVELSWLAMPLGGAGELSLCLWLLAKGVRPQPAGTPRQPHS